MRLPSTRQPLRSHLQQWLRQRRNLSLLLERAKDGPQESRCPYGLHLRQQRHRHRGSSNHSPRRSLPTIFIEFWYDISPFDGTYGANDRPRILSNGDPTGYSFHADLVHGWETGVLEEAIAKQGGCNCGCECCQTEIEPCFGPVNVNKNTHASFQTCAISHVQQGNHHSRFDTPSASTPPQPAHLTPVAVKNAQDPEPTVVGPAHGDASAGENCKCNGTATLTLTRTITVTKKPCPSARATRTVTTRHTVTVEG